MDKNAKNIVVGTLLSGICCIAGIGGYLFGRKKQGSKKCEELVEKEVEKECESDKTESIEVNDKKCEKSVESCDLSEKQDSILKSVLDAEQENPVLGGCPFHKLCSETLTHVRYGEFLTMQVLSIELAAQQKECVRLIYDDDNAVDIEKLMLVVVEIFNQNAELLPQHISYDMFEGKLDGKPMKNYSCNIEYIDESVCTGRSIMLACGFKTKYCLAFEMCDKNWDVFELTYQKGDTHKWIFHPGDHGRHVFDNYQSATFPYKMYPCAENNSVVSKDPCTIIFDEAVIVHFDNTEESYVVWKFTFKTNEREYVASDEDQCGYKMSMYDADGYYCGYFAETFPIDMEIDGYSHFHKAYGINKNTTVKLYVPCVLLPSQFKFDKFLLYWSFAGYYDDTVIKPSVMFDTPGFIVATKNVRLMSL